MKDHPRRCGENGDFCLCRKLYVGSPPQVRGKPDTPADETEQDRITPAGAGKTVCLTAPKRTKRDHPRRCGENTSAASQVHRQSGSPPQVRGKQERAVGIVQQSRITPAGAGKTSQLFLRVLIRPGSPPQVRGKQSHVRCCRGCIGITPAGAGKTCALRLPRVSRQDHPRRCGENLPLEQ